MHPYLSMSDTTPCLLHHPFQSHEVIQRPPPGSPPEVPETHPKPSPLASHRLYQSSSNSNSLLGLGGEAWWQTSCLARERPQAPAAPHTQIKALGMSHQHHGCSQNPCLFCRTLSPLHGPLSRHKCSPTMQMGKLSHREASHHLDGRRQEQAHAGSRVLPLYDGSH